MRRFVRHIIRSFGLIERILRDRLDYFAATNRGQELPGTIGKLLTVTVLGFAVAGFVGGLSGGDLTSPRSSYRSYSWPVVSSVYQPCITLACYSGRGCVSSRRSH
jgi:hypothetical protein